MFRRFIVTIISIFICQDKVLSASCVGGNRYFCRNIFTAQRCDVMNECVAIWRTSVWEKYRDDNSTECFLCRTLADSLPVAELKPLCSLLNRSNTPECEKIIGQLPKTLMLQAFDKLENERDIDILCNTLSARKTDLYIGGLDFGSVACDDCNKLVNRIRDFIADNASIDAITSEFNSVICARLNNHETDYCEETVKVHVPRLLDLIKMHLDPTDVCAILRLCPKSLSLSATLIQLLNRNNPTHSDSFSSPNVKSLLSLTTYSWIDRHAGRNACLFTSNRCLRGTSDLCPPECQNCAAMLDKIKETTKNPTWQGEITKELQSQICNPLESISEMCKSAINGQLKEFIDELEEVDSYTVCSVFQVYTSNATHLDDILQTATQSSHTLPGMCQVCKLMMEKLVDLLIDKPTEESIKVTLRQICTLVPRSYRKQCDHFAQKFAPQIMQAMVDGKALKSVCTSFGLCPEQFMPPVLVQLSRWTAPKHSSYCSTCKGFADLAHRQLLLDRTEEELKKLAKPICAILPGAYASECDSLVDEYLGEVVQYLKQNLTPDEVCEKIGFCPEEAGALQAPCLRGPAYWCLTRETAEQCNATAICTPRRFQRPASHQLCSALDRAEICASFELAAGCGLARECLEQRMMTYLQSVSLLLNIRPQIYLTDTYNVQQSSPLNCTICMDVLEEWTTNRKVLGTPFFAVQPCTKYTHPVDREQCNRVWTHRYPAIRQLLRSNANPETVCTRMNLCRAAVTPVSVSPCLDNPFYAVSSRRAAEECGTLDLWTQLQQLETKPIRTETTPTPSRVIPVPDIPACRGGPDQFCETYETAQLCGHAAVRDCQDHVWFGSRPRASNRNPPLLGVVHCTWGPSYWCSSREAARSCGQEAVDYCIRQRAFA